MLSRSARIINSLLPDLDETGQDWGISETPERREKQTKGKNPASSPSSSGFGDLGSAAALTPALGKQSHIGGSLSRCLNWALVRIE